MIQSLGQRVIQLNNQAIEVAIEGYRKDGVVILQQALALLLTVQENNKVSVATRSCEQQRARRTYSVPLSRKQCSQTFDDIFQFYDRAITFAEDDERFSTLSCPRTCTHIQATILYNLGVICHKEAVCSGTSTMAFVNALQFYAGAYTSLESSPILDDDAILLVLSLFNNMGHIHSSFMMDSGKTQLCVSWMQSTFAAPHTHHALSPHDYDFFSQYISVPAESQLAISPAA